MSGVNQTCSSPFGASCGTNLRETWTDEPFPLHSPINLAQTLITVAWSRSQPQLSIEIPDLEHLLSTARGVGIALLAAADIDLIARSGHHLGGAATASPRSVPSFSMST